jgi:hypothetical protein
LKKQISRKLSAKIKSFKDQWVRSESFKWSWCAENLMYPSFFLQDLLTAEKKDEELF